MPEISQPNIPDLGLPREVSCPACGAEVLLDKEEQQEGRYECPECANLITYPEGKVEAPHIQFRPELEHTSCINHKDSQAVLNCHLCQSAICRTCDFYYAEAGLHICPQCAVNAPEAASPEVKHHLTWALVMSGISAVLLIVLLFASMSVNSDETIEGLWMGLGLLIIGSNIAGIGFSTALNPAVVSYPLGLRIAKIWNYTLFGLFMALIFFGSFA